MFTRKSFLVYPNKQRFLEHPARSVIEIPANEIKSAEHLGTDSSHKLEIKLNRKYKEIAEELKHPDKESKSFFKDGDTI